MQGLPHPVSPGTVNYLLHSTPQPWTLPELCSQVAQCTPMTLAGYETRIAESLLHEWLKAGRVHRVDGGELPRYRRV